MWFKIRAVWRRELLDSVRDKRTLYMMVLLPIVLMPGIMLLGPVMAVRQQESLAGQVPVALVAGGDQLPGLMEWIKATGALAIETAPPGSGPEEWAQRLGAGEVQLVVELPPDARDRAAAEEPVIVRVVVAGGNPRSARAAALWGALLERYSREVIAGRLQARGLSPGLLEPFVVEEHDITPPAQWGGRILGMLVPFFIVVWAVAGGMYTAIDAGAGEKERNSLESLIMTPVPGTVIVAGKALAVATIAMVAVLLLVLSTSVSMLYLLPRIIGAQGWLPVELSPSGLLGLLATMTLFVAFVSAVQLAFSVFSKSFREAQAYVTGLMFAVMLPAVYLMFVEETGAALWMYLVPVLNVLLVCREVLQGTAGLPQLLLTLGSLAAAAGLAFALALRAFASERVLFRT